MQEVNRTVQTQRQKGAVQEQQQCVLLYKPHSNSNLNNSNTFTPMVKNNDIKSSVYKTSPQGTYTQRYFPKNKSCKIYLSYRCRFWLSQPYAR